MDSNKKCCYELKLLAKKAGIKGYYEMKKEELSIALGFGPIINEVQKGGGKKCKHGKIMRYCVPCGGSAICPHGIRKYVCRPCGGSQLCKHLNQKHQCRECRRERLAQEQTYLPVNM